MSIETRILHLTARIMRDDEGIAFFDALNQAVNESAHVFQVDPASCNDSTILLAARQLGFEILTGLRGTDRQEYMEHLANLINQTDRRTVLHFLGRV